EVSKQRAGGRLRPFWDVEPGGRDEQLLEVLASEGARRHWSAGERDHVVELALRREAEDGSAVPERDPDAALGIDGEAVGHAQARLDVGESLSLAEHSVDTVERERVDAAGGRID